MTTESSIQLREEQGIRLAVEGCGHGTLHAIYASIQKACEIKGWPGVDLLIIGGDFQAVRNAYDLNCVAMPAKYREMCDFHEYYSGSREAPYLTVFVGGNHEASNYLFELYYGGWVAKNIYYAGAANVLRLGPLRIAGLSGIWKGYSYKKPHHERLPYNESDMKSVYHVRELDTRKLLQVSTQVDVGISHDWPRGVEWMGNSKALFRRKEHLEQDARDGQLGSVAAKLVMERLRPRYWFSAHLHCKYAALVKHGEEATPTRPGPPHPQENGNWNGLAANSTGPMTSTSTSADAGPKNSDEIDLDLEDDNDPQPQAQVSFSQPSNGQIKSASPPRNTDEIDLELEDEGDGITRVAPGQGMDGVEVSLSADKPPTIIEPDMGQSDRHAPLSESVRPSRPIEAVEHPPGITNKTTQFLALDKCLPNRDFLQLLSVDTVADPEATTLQRPLKLQYDQEWLAITRTFAVHEPLLLGDPKFNAPRPKSAHEYSSLIKEQRDWIDQHVSGDALTVPDDFELTAPVYDGGNFRDAKYSLVREYTNPQTSRFCGMLDIPNPFDLPDDERMERMKMGPRPETVSDSFGGGRGRGGMRGRGRGRGGGPGRGRGRGGGRGGFRGH